MSASPQGLVASQLDQQPVEPRLVLRAVGERVRQRRLALGDGGVQPAQVGRGALPAQRLHGGDLKVGAGLVEVGQRGAAVLQQGAGVAPDRVDVGYRYLRWPDHRRHHSSLSRLSGGAANAVAYQPPGDGLVLRFVREQVAPPCNLVLGRV